MPEPEIEVQANPLAREMQLLGCPYHPLHPSAKAWLKGYQTGFSEGGAAARCIYTKAMDAA